MGHSFSCANTEFVQRRVVSNLPSVNIICRQILIGFYNKCLCAVIKKSEWKPKQWRDNTWCGLHVVFKFSRINKMFRSVILNAMNVDISRLSISHPQRLEYNSLSMHCCC